MKILITGGCGFIGSNLVRYFKSCPLVEKISVMDNLSRKGSGYNQQWLYEQYPDLRFYLADVTNRNWVDHVVKSERPDVIIHTAGQVAVTSSVDNPMHDFETNVVGTLNVLEAARELGNVHVVYLSTNKVYGELDLPYIEETTRYRFALREGISEFDELDFQTPYGCSKGAADQYVLDYGRTYGISTTVLRLSCIYGPRQFGIVDQGWVAYLMMKAIRGDVIEIYGSGKQVRDVLSVADLCFVVHDVITLNATGVYNVGGGKENTMSIIEYLDKLFDMGYNVNYINKDWRPSDQKIYYSDISKLYNTVGWEPCIDVDDGLKILSNWLETNRELWDGES